ncbi:MAG: aminotransferase class I/II-fold pyridoxal phosphate-dependent enzyme [Armatimonadetes bacterium]|nr:aminotransferase class I/II-fold pyridoxal phosphate-dependent enzyme [Armatimonadota bacterium]
MSRPPRPRIARNIADLPPSGIREFFDLVSELENVISLGVGEPDFPTPWHICDEVYDALRRGRTQYTSNLGMIELRREISRMLAERYGAEYDPANEIIVTVGVSEGLDVALRAILNPGDEVIVPDPSFVAYAPSVKLAGGVAVLAPMGEADAFRLRPDVVRSLITERTRALLIGFPNNPTGSVMTRKELASLAEIAREHDLLVLSDEIYDRLTYEGTHTCFPTLPGMAERTILLNGFSKSYAMTGWRIGYACAPKDVVAAMVAIHSYTMMSAPTPAQIAAIEALRRGEPDVERMKSQYNQRRRLLVQGLRDLGLGCFEPLGAFYVFPNITRAGLDSRTFSRRLVQEQGVAVVPGPAFGPSGEGYVRATYATSMDNLKEALRRIERFVAGL